MSPTTTLQDLNRLANAIVHDGIEPHHQAVAAIADKARQASRCLAAADVLADDDAPEVLRSRALLTIARHWDEISSAEAAGFDRSLEAFLAQWNLHEQMRSTGDIEALSQSRLTLDGLRDKVNAPCAAC